jgi:pantoate--beta-alanine ligase
MMPVGQIHPSTLNFPALEHSIMLTLKSPKKYQKHCLEWRGEGFTHALVPTMGAFHEGHVHLVRKAREIADRVSVSIFLNPTQFGPNEDLENYPQSLETDCGTCQDLGVDLVFAPATGEIYPKNFRSTVRVDNLTEPLCGRFRPGHFEGVTTIVTKLFNLALPTDAVFGWKDAQQLIILKQLVSDLNLPIVMHGVETVREPDGLAFSTRNHYLNAEERDSAGLVYAGLTAARKAFEDGMTHTVELESLARRVMEDSSLIQVRYLESRSLSTLERLETVETGNTLIATAVLFSRTRLIDNIRF